MNWSSDVLYQTGTTLVLPDLVLVVPPNVLILYVGSSIGAHHVGRHPPTVLRRLATLAAARGLSESKVKKTLEEKEAPMAEWSKMIQLLSVSSTSLGSLFYFIIFFLYTFCCIFRREYVEKYTSG